MAQAKTTPYFCLANRSLAFSAASLMGYLTIKSFRVFFAAVL
jgi:hypothetical protein